MPQETTQVTLNHPFTTAAGVRVESLTMRRAKVRDIRAAGRHGDSKEEQEVALFAILTGYTPEDFDAMDWADYLALQDSFRALVAGCENAETGADAAGGGAALPA